MKPDSLLQQRLVSQAAFDGINRLVVGAAIVRQGRVLLLRRRAGDFMEGIYELPSGVVELGEDLGQALAREVWEETGLQVKEVVAYLGCFDYTSGSGQPTRQFTFEVAVQLQRDIHLSEHDAYVWANRSSLKEIRVTPEVRQVLESLGLEASEDYGPPR